MSKIIETRISKMAPRYSSETVVINGGLKFKIVAENDNCYSRLRIYVYTNNGELAIVATEYDIPDYEKVNYFWDDNERLVGNRNNIIAAEKYIESVW